MKKSPLLLGIMFFLCLGLIFFLLVYLLSSRDGTLFISSDRVGIVTITGVITDSHNVVEDLKKFGDDRTVRAIVLRIDSPGGGVAASQEIFQGILEIRKKKKVVASLGALAASGGYLVACGADEIVANPGTVTGSISALMQFPNVEELFKKLGVKSTVVKSGKFKDIGSPLRPVTPEEKALLQALVDDIYEQFLDVIVKSRNIPKEELKKIADGRVFTGKMAKELKLVDHLGDLNYAVDQAGRLAGIKGKPRVIYAKKRITSWWDFLWGKFSRAGGALEYQLSPLALYQYL